MRFVPSRGRAQLTTHGGVPASESGRVVVAVAAWSARYDTVEWAAAEAVARGVHLEIMHAYDRPPIVDPLLAPSQMAQRSVDAEATERILRRARTHAKSIAPLLPITTRAALGPARSSILRHARGASLIVVGRAAHPSRRRWQLPLAAYLARRSPIPLAVVDLATRRVDGPYAGLVVLQLHGPGPHSAGIAAGYRAAQRRGTPLVVESQRTRSDNDFLPATWRELTEWHARYPDVLVEIGTPGLDTAAGAALLVVSGAYPSRFCPAFLPTPGGFTHGAVLESHAGPVLFAPRPRRTASRGRGG